MELYTPRLHLRECRPEDHAAIHAFASDPEVTRYTVWGPNTPEDTAAFLGKAAWDARWTQRTRFVLAVVERWSDAVVGWIRLEIVNEQHGRAELGYALSPTRRGRGYATEAGTAMLGFAFDLGLRKVTATCDPLNRSSVKVLERIGMHHEGYLRDHVLVRGQWRDRLLYGVVSTMDIREGRRPAASPALV
ncbi:MAG: GNAT family N-acetyltransferase [Micromonosporaceae bacterium]|nr:GNAT family N-acetyltransferase [Micromonosporaceae bacterium]